MMNNCELIGGMALWPNIRYGKGGVGGYGSIFTQNNGILLHVQVLQLRPNEHAARVSLQPGAPVGL